MTPSKCTNCGKIIDVPEHYIGKSVRCMSCGSMFDAEKYTATSIPHPHFSPKPEIKPEPEPEPEPEPVAAVDKSTSIQDSNKSNPIGIFFAVFLAMLVAGGILLYLSKGSESKIIGYETKIEFISDYGSWRLDSLTKDGWEIKSSRRAWTSSDHAYDDTKIWGTEYTLQKPTYSK